VRISTAMKFSRNFPITFALLLIVALPFSGHAQDDVTIPKSRLEELQRKEAELEKLKGELKTTKGENVQLKKQHQEDAAKNAIVPPAQPVVTHASPPMASLAPLVQGDTVDAMDLANYYKADASAADQRFRKRTFKVQGEIASFEKPLFIRDYRIVLRTADREMRVIGTFSPPEKYNAVLTIRSGSELVGDIAGRARERIAKVGDVIVIRGECRGLSDSSVRMSGCGLVCVSVP